MKKIFVVALTLALLVVMTVPAMAAGGPGGKGGGGAGNGSGSVATPASAPVVSPGTGSETAAKIGVGTVPGTGNGTAAKVGAEKGNESGIFAMVGSIVEIDPVAYTVSVSVVGGNKLTQPSIGQTVTVQATEATRFLLSYQVGVSQYSGTSAAITFEDLVVGQDVSVNGEMEEGAWVASRFTVAPQLFQYFYSLNK
jgi:hypothetical protein